MLLDIILHADAFPNEKDYLKSEIEKNVTGKLDNYLKKYLNQWEGIVRAEGFFERADSGKVDIKSRFNGKIILTVGTTTFRTEREDFAKLDDLVSHLFSHIKEQMAK